MIGVFCLTLARMICKYQLCICSKTSRVDLLSHYKYTDIQFMQLVYDKIKIRTNFSFNEKLKLLFINFELWKSRQRMSLSQYIHKFLFDFRSFKRVLTTQPPDPNLENILTF